MRKFNVAGPCEPDRHYMIEPISRLPGARELVEDMSFFVVHAPRQTGKTTSLRALATAITHEGRYAALHLSCETAQAAGDDVLAAQNAILDQVRIQAKINLPVEFQPPDPWPESSELARIQVGLVAWAQKCPLPLVLVLDEVDAVRGNSLTSLLRQLRAGYPNRPKAFPHSVVLCGLRDVREYKAASGGDPGRLGTASPFNIKVESMRIGDFSSDEVEQLYCQHTQQTGQAFTEQAVARAFDVTQGQPWLVNALGRELVEKMTVTGPIEADHVEQAKERLILARATHLDSLVARLEEFRVRRVLEPVISGSVDGGGDSYDDDVQYARDLGLLRLEKPLEIANPIYREVIVRVLANRVEDKVNADARSFVLEDGRLSIQKLLGEFAEFWREHGDILAASMTYQEAAPQLVLMAFLQRIVNGGGYIDREYGIGRGRIDLLLRWPYGRTNREWQREAMELKVWIPKKADPLARGLVQLEGYLDRLGLKQGVLAIFDRRPEAAPIEERTKFESAQTAKGYQVTVLRG